MDDIGREVEYVRWSDMAMQSLDIDWEDSEFQREQRNYQTSSGDAISPRNQVTRACEPGSRAHSDSWS